MDTFLDYIDIYNAKAAVVIKNLIINGDTQTATLLSSLKSTANDTSLTDSVRLNALTALINRGGLLDIPLAPYFPSAVSYQSTQVYTGIHNDLNGLNTGDYWHLTYSEYLSVLNKASIGDITFGNLSGDVADNDALVTEFNGKENLIPISTGNKFFSWDKTWRDIDWSYITNAPTTLAGLGISSSDTLFDGKYLRTSTILSSYTIGSNTPIANTDTVIGAFGNLQAQIDAVASSTGTINFVGITTPANFFLTIGNSPLTGNGGSISLNLASQTQGQVFASPAASNGAPSFRSLIATDLPITGFPAGVYGDNTQYPVITVDDYGRVTSISLQSAAGSGTVQSVEVTMPDEFTTNGVVITSSGTISFGWDNQTAGKVLAAPATVTGVPAFRTLVASDIPNIEISQVNQLQDALNNNANLNSLPNGQIFIGNTSSQPTPRFISGVISLDNTGATTANQNTFPLTGLEIIPTNTLLGRYDAPDGDVQVVTLSSDFNLNSFGELWLATPPIPLITTPGELITYNASAVPVPAQAALPPPSEGQILVGWPTRPAPDEYGLIWVTPGGVIDTIGTDGTVTLLDNSIDYSKLFDSASANVILGVGSTPGAISALNSADATAILDSFAGTTKGLVPGGSGNDPTLFLAGDGTWLPAAGGGGTTTFPLTIKDDGSGDVSGSTFDGSAAITISYNSIGAPSTSGANATGTWSIDISGNAGTVTNGLYSTGSYSDPSWLTSIQGSIVSGDIPGGSGYVANSLTIKNDGTGDVSGTVFDGSGAVSISYNSIGAPSTSGANATGTWSINISGNAGTVSNGLYSTGSYSNPTWLTSISGGIVSGNISGSAGSVANDLTVGSGLKYNSGTTYNGGAAKTISLNTATSNNWSALQTFSASSGIYLGEVSTASGNLRFIGGTSGYVNFTVAATTANQSYILPSSAGTTGDFLKLSNSSTGELVWASVSSGSGTVTSGGPNQLAYYLSSGTTVQGLTTGTGVLTALGIAVGTAGSFVTNGGALGTPTSGNFSTGTFTWPTFNQNTTGSAASLTNARTIQTNLASSSSASFDGTANITPGVTGTLPVANGGTGQTTYTNGQLLIGNTTGNTLTKATLTQGAGITITNGAGSITIASSASAPTLNSIQAASAGNTINNANFAQEWQWNTLAGGNGLFLSSTSTAAASNTQTLFRVALSGANATSTQSTYAGVLSNTHTGTSSTNYALQLTASGATTNYALDVTAGIFRAAAGTAGSPQMILTPSSALTFTGTVNGSLWYDTASSNSSITIYKDSGYTKLITKDRNPDLATGTSFGVVLADTAGTLSKSADLTALGIFSGTADGATLSGAGNADLLPTSVVGSKTLSGNFFSVGKTLEIFVCGRITTVSSPGNLVLTLQVGTAGTPITVGALTMNLHNNVTNGYWEARFTVVCLTIGSGTSSTTRTTATSLMTNGGTTSGNSLFTYLTKTTSSGFDSTTTQLIQLNGAFTAANSVTVENCYAQYLN